MNPSLMHRHGASPSSPYRRRRDEEQDSFGANDLQRWYAMFLSVILSYLQLSQQQRQGGGVGVQTASLCFSIALITLTTSSPLPCSSKALQIGLFHLILGCAFLLSWAVPNILWWTPYFSCIRPFFHLLPDRLQLQILQFSRSVWDRFRLQILQFSRSVRNGMKLLVSIASSYVGPNVESSSPIQANFNSQQVVEIREEEADSNSQQVIELRDQEVSSTNASMSLASSSSQA